MQDGRGFNGARLRTGDLIVDVDGDTDACARLRTQPQRAVLAIKRGVGRHSVTFNSELEAIQVPPAATADVTSECQRVPFP
jgi:hypothetical protein